MATVITVPDNALVLEIAIQAKARHLFLISNGNRSVLSPVVPSGWTVLIDPASKRTSDALSVAS